MADSAPETPPVRPAQPRPTVTSVTGQEVQLLHEREERYYNEAKAKYLDDYTFTHANDYRVLDRLLLLEVQCERYQWYTAAGIYYDATLLTTKDEADYRRAVKELQAQISELQKDLGVSKSERERQTSHNDVGSYIEELRQRAKEFGVMREQQVDKSLTLTKELFAMVGAFLRSNEHERRKLGIESADQILEWIQDYMKPEFDAIDEHFRNREDGQKYWIRNI